MSENYYYSPCQQSQECSCGLRRSDDNGATFTRALNLWPGGSGYTGLACGLPGEEDCAVLFDSDSHGLDLLRFSSKDVKRAADTEARLPAPPPPPAVGWADAPQCRLRA